MCRLDQTGPRPTDMFDREELPMRRLAFILLAAMILVAAVGAQLAAPVVAQEEQDEARSDPDGLSLEPGRTIAFTTTEGTYMNLDVSPDGRWLAFAVREDIFVAAIPLSPNPPGAIPRVATRKPRSRSRIPARSPRRSRSG